MNLTPQTVARIQEEVQTRLAEALTDPKQTSALRGAAREVQDLARRVAGQVGLDTAPITLSMLAGFLANLDTTHPDA